MAKPPPSGPSSDIGGVNRDARISAPGDDPADGGADAKNNAQKQSKAQPKDAGPRGES